MIRFRKKSLNFNKLLRLGFSQIIKLKIKNKKEQYPSNCSSGRKFQCGPWPPTKFLLHFDKNCNNFQNRVSYYKTTRAMLYSSHWWLCQSPSNDPYIRSLAWELPATNSWRKNIPRGHNSNQENYKMTFVFDKIKIYF